MSDTTSNAISLATMVDEEDPQYYSRLQKSLTREMSRENSSNVATTDHFCQDEEEEDEEENERLNSAEFDGEDDKADRIADQFEGQRLNARARAAGPKKRGAKREAELELMRIASAQLLAAEQAQLAARSQQQQPQHNQPPSNLQQQQQQYTLIAGAALSGAAFAAAQVAPAVASRAAHFDPRKVIEIADDRDKMTRRLLDNKILTMQIPAMTQKDTDHIIACFDAMIEMFCGSSYFSRAGDACHDLRAITAGQPIPSYFANVQSESVVRRKLLTLLGLRNLALPSIGVRVFEELRKNLFSHSSPGIELLRQYFGTILDVDTVVLRLNDPMSLAAVNAMRGGQPPFRSCSEFAASHDSKVIAANAARQMCQDFIDLLRLNEGAARARKVLPSTIDENKIPVATCNTDRGMAPLWRYSNAGQDSYSANVPSVTEILDALLRTPFIAARNFAILCLQNGPSAKRPSDKDEQLFYDECLHHGCLNAKLAQIQAFADLIANRGSIKDVLAKLMQEHQQEFCKLYAEDDDDHECTKEKELLWKIVSGSLGRDKAGVMRLITEADCKAYVDSPNKDI